MFQLLQANNFGLLLYAMLYLVIFRNRLYYLLFLGIASLALGVWALEFAPAFFLPVQFILDIVSIFRGLQARVMSLSDGN